MRVLERGSAIEKAPGGVSLYAGGSVNNLGAKKLTEITWAVSRELTARPNTMIPFSQPELKKNIKEKRAAVVLDGEGGLRAFAQYWPYEVDNTGDEFMRGLTVFEVGSWISFAKNSDRGHGRRVFEACLAVGKMQHPEAAFITIIEEGNERAAGILGDRAERVGEKESKQVRGADGNPARMIIYRLN